jgi:hypothetical protein
MKFNLIKTLSFFLIFCLAFTLIYSVTSCSENNDIESNNSIDKTNSLEYKDALFAPQADGSILKYEKNKVVYGLDLKNEFSASRITNSKKNSNSYRITNPITTEFFDIVNIVEEGNYFKFNAITSSGEQIYGMKYYGSDFISGLENYSNKDNKKANENQIQCGPCIRVLVVVAAAIISSLEDSPLQQCSAAMQALNCSGGSHAYMQFSEGWFSTTCNIGCR